MWRWRLIDRQLVYAALVVIGISAAFIVFPFRDWPEWVKLAATVFGLISWPMALVLAKRQ